MSLASLLININLSYSQRNLNQKQFKSKAAEVSSLEDDQDIQLSVEYEQKTNSYSKSAGDNGKPAKYNNTSTFNYYKKDNEIVLDVHALMNVKASSFLAVFNLTQVGETAAKTDELINLRINNFLIALKELGINDKDIYIDMIYLVPTFEFEVQKKLFSKTTYNEVPTGFEMQKNIHLRFNDINKVDDIVTLAAKNEIYDMVKIDFFVNDTEKIYDSLRNESVENIKKKLSSLKEINLNLNDKYQIVNESSYAIYPETQYSDYDAFVNQSLEAVKKETGVSTIRKPKTVAYDQISYNKYDIVINPEILEPVVQFVYILQVKYTLEKPDTTEKKNYMLITPAGEIKTLDIK